MPQSKKVDRQQNQALFISFEMYLHWTFIRIHFLGGIRLYYFKQTNFLENEIERGTINVRLMFLNVN